jgi:uncharacterized protein YlxP (DUF503 family)
VRVGAVRVVLDFYNNTHLTTKKRALAALCEDVRKTFLASAAEIDAFDDLERGVIGVAIVFTETTETSRCRDKLEAIGRHIDATAPARVISEEAELLEHAGSFETESEI